jgi:hypothetical protein
MEAEMTLRDEIERIQEVLKVNERSMRSPDRELFHSILGALKDIEDASCPKVRLVVDEPPRWCDPARLADTRPRLLTLKNAAWATSRASTHTPRPSASPVVVEIVGR